MTRSGGSWLISGKVLVFGGFSGRVHIAYFPGRVRYGDIGFCLLTSTGRLLDEYDPLR
jgi:hypothetical protein